MQQIITIATDGTISGLQRKPGQGLDLTKLGKASVVRASEIVWDEDEQGWKIDVLQEAGKGVVTLVRFAEAVAPRCPSSIISEATGPNDWRHSPDYTLLFWSYDHAVKVEVLYLDALRLKGIF